MLWSSVSTTSFSTQIVMTNGIQIRRPVIRYFFKVGGAGHAAARRGARAAKRESR
jgi:hypothetical protein